MPTTKPRHAITETEQVAAALAAAAKRWPEDKDRPSRLLMHLIDVGRAQVEVELTDYVSARREAIREAAGSFTGCFEPGFLDELRDEWER